MNTNEHFWSVMAKKKELKMFSNERQDEILDILNKNKSATVEELASELFVSGATIRRDLREMEKQGLIKRFIERAARFCDSSPRE